MRCFARISSLFFLALSATALPSQPRWLGHHPVNVTSLNGTTINSTATTNVAPTGSGPLRGFICHNGICRPNLKYLEKKHVKETAINNTTTATATTTTIISNPNKYTASVGKVPPIGTVGYLCRRYSICPPSLKEIKGRQVEATTTSNEASATPQSLSEIPGYVCDHSICRASSEGTENRQVDKTGINSKPPTNVKRWSFPWICGTHICGSPPKNVEKRQIGRTLIDSETPSTPAPIDVGSPTPPEGSSSDDQRWICNDSICKPV